MRATERKSYGNPSPRASRTAATLRLRGVLLIGVLAACWEVAADTRLISPFLFPAPSAIFNSIQGGFGFAGGNGTLGWHILLSLYRLLTGLALATVFGMLIGVAIGTVKAARLVLSPILSALMPIPTLAWTPILLLITGVDNATTIIIVFVAALFEIVYNVVTAVESTNVRLFWVAQSMGALRAQVFWKVILPATLPYLITGIKLASGYAWRALIAAEMLAASSYGLGFMIYDASEYMNMTDIYAGLVVIAILGFLLENVLLGWIEEATVLKWGVQVER